MINPATGLPYQIGDNFGTGSTVTGFTPSGAPALTGNPRPGAPPPFQPPPVAPPVIAPPAAQPPPNVAPPVGATVNGSNNQANTPGWAQPILTSPFATPLSQWPHNLPQTPGLNTQGNGQVWTPTVPMTPLAPSPPPSSGVGVHPTPNVPAAGSVLSGPASPSPLTAPTTTSASTTTSPAAGFAASGPTARTSSGLGSRLLPPSLRNTGRWGRSA